VGRVGSLSVGTWLRFGNGRVGVIEDKADNRRF